MSKSDQGRYGVDDFLAAAPGTEAWSAASAWLAKRFGRLDTEDQVRVAERLLSLGAGEGVAEAVDAAYGSAGVSLPALTVLARARVEGGREANAELPAELEKWLTACENDEAECGALDFFGLPGEARAAIADHLALWMRGDALARLRDAAPDKKDAKELAKALHRAKSAGATVTDAAAGTTFVMPERDEYADEAYLSPPDAQGYYFLYLYRTVFGKNNLFVLLVSDREGVQRFDNYQITRPKFQRILDSTRKNPHAVIVKVDAGWARRFVRSAEESGIGHGVRQREDYLGKRRALGIADEGEGAHAVWTKLKREDIAEAGGLVFRSGELAAHRIFADWRLEAAEPGRLLSGLAELEHSLLTLTEPQKRERENDLLAKAAMEVIELTGREIWRDRLLNCAYLLALMGDDEAAKMTAAVALAVERPSELTPVPSFFVELMRRSAAQDRAPEGEPPEGGLPDRGGLIVS